MTNGKPLYQIIVDHFQHELAAGKLAAGDQIPTELELSQMFKVSRITVNRAVKELVHLGLVYRVRGRGSFISENTNRRFSYPPNDIWVDSGSAALPMLSVVFPFDEQTGYEFLQGVENICEKAGLYVTFHSSHSDSRREKEIIEKLRRDRVQGIIIYPCSSVQNIDVFSDMIIHQYPFVIIDRNIEGLETSLVVSNNHQGSYEATTHLIHLGHRRIAFVGDSFKEYTSIQERYRGYCQALVDGGISPRNEWIIDNFSDVDKEKLHFHDDPPDMNLEAAASVLNRILFLEQKPTALVAINDYIAMYLLKAALKMGISVPVELSITGFDNLSFTEHLEVPLTTVEQPFRMLGEQAASLLIKQVVRNQVRGKESNKIVLDTKLIIRQSTSAPA